jgi:hypothetical protein
MNILSPKHQEYSKDESDDESIQNNQERINSSNAISNRILPIREN